MVRNGAPQQQHDVHEAAEFRTNCGVVARIASGLLT
jgi:hypothetical protein